MAKLDPVVLIKIKKIKSQSARLQPSLPVPYGHSSVCSFGCEVYTPPLFYTLTLHHIPPSPPRSSFYMMRAFLRAIAPSMKPQLGSRSCVQRQKGHLMGQVHLLTIVYLKDRF